MSRIVPPASIPIDVLVTAENFDERDYLTSNLDVAQAVAGGHLPSGRFHYKHYGSGEGRTMRNSSAIVTAQAEKLERIAPILCTDLPFRRRGAKPARRCC